MYNDGIDMYKYILWDIDGTVLDFLASEAYAIRTLFKKYNIGKCIDSYEIYDHGKLAEIVCT